eukprot:scaffold58322_cov67-Phaeocystis_antarctica.AAC.6
MQDFKPANNLMMAMIQHLTKSSATGGVGLPCIVRRSSQFALVCGSLCIGAAGARARHGLTPSTLDLAATQDGVLGAHRAGPAEPRRLVFLARFHNRLP